MKNILTWVSLLVGEIIIIAAFLLWRGDIESSILILNIVVSMIVYWLFAVDIVTPWFDNSGSRIGSLGVRWIVTLLYAIAAVGVMLACNLLLDSSFEFQLIVQGILLVILILGIVASMNTTAQTQSVAAEQSRNRVGVDRMRTTMQKLREDAAMHTNLPQECIARIEQLADDMRYISPSDAPEAIDIENRFIAIIHQIESILPRYETEAETVNNHLAKAERLYKNRKSIYSK